MSQIVELQQLITKYRKDKNLATMCHRLQATPEWREVIEVGFTQELTKELVSKLASASEDKRQEYLVALTGVSVLAQYLKDVTEGGENADQYIFDAETAISELLGENHE